ncbi:MAG: sterol desaturase family protein [Rhizomicrobium sp.]
MSGYLIAHMPAVRLIIFLGLLAGVAGWEMIAPRRRRMLSRKRRWPHNLGISVVNTLSLRVLLPAAAVGFAAWAEQKGWGLFNTMPLPLWLVVILSITLLDLTVYLQHVMFHALPLLWRVHRVHHTDMDFDVTTALRFHPVEIILSMMVKLAAIAILGAPAIAVLFFEIILNATAMFNHANASLPAAIEPIVRLLVVTPDFHRVHHSVIRAETNSNFGFNAPWWDWIFGTYRAQPSAGHATMRIGLEEFRDPAQERLDRLLLQPWRKAKQDAPLAGPWS